MSLFVQNLTVYLNKIKVISNFSLNIDKGNLIFLLGNAKSGKTILLYSIAGYGSHILKKEGLITLDNKNIIYKSPYFISQQKIFMGFQTFPFQKGISILNLISNITNIHQIKHANIYNTIYNYLDILNLSKSIINKPINNNNLSLIEQKKIEILQMMIIKPQYILLDDIYNGLDINSIQLIHNIIINMIENNNSGILCTINTKSIIKHISNYSSVYFISQGKNIYV